MKPREWTLCFNGEEGYVCSKGVYFVNANSENVDVIEKSAYDELKAKLEMANRALESIVDTKASGSEVYCFAESVKYEAEQALKEME